ncbi:MAG: alpha-glucosidase/alpha-galactosidase [Vallitaleaceae bacterium]|nr:alpha-glucosidase/alpha-galactosidase [Vallitaleaceae bacterium]
MVKITFMGAGSTVFAKNVLGDCLCTPSLKDAVIALYDIDEERLKESEMMLKSINKNSNDNRATILSYLDRKEALRGAKYVVNAIQVGGYDPCTITDFEIPKKFGLRQTIADTLGIGGIFRALRTIPVMLDFAKDMEEVCPDAWFLNYTNPMSMVTLAMLKGSKIKTVGLCHSVQVCAKTLLEGIELDVNEDSLETKIAGINHMSWLLTIAQDGKDLYPQIKQLALDKGAPKDNQIRFELMKQFGYYVTESSEHNAEYLPYFIKNSHPELIERFNIPLDEYPRRCINQIASWNTQKEALIGDEKLQHTRSHEYASYIMEAMETNIPYKIGGNVLNTGLITNLPDDCCVEVPCLVDRSGVTPTYVGKLPEQLAALNRTNINVHLLTVEAALTLKREYIYYAAMLDPHTSAELTIEEIKQMCDELIIAHGDYLPTYQ